MRRVVAASAALLVSCSLGACSADGSIDSAVDPAGDDSTYVDGLNNGPGDDITAGACSDWVVDGQCPAGTEVTADQQAEQVVPLEPASPEVEGVRDRVSARMRGPLSEEFLESFTQVVGAGSAPDTDLGGVALMVDYYGGTPVIYTDYGAFRIDLLQELLDAPPELDDSYTSIGEFSVTGRIGFVDHRYAVVWMPGSTDESGPHRLRISARVTGELQELLVQAWPAPPSPPQQIKPAPGS